MKKILLISFTALALQCAAQIKVKDLPTTTSGSTGDFLIKDDAAGISGSTKKISIGNFISTYSLQTALIFSSPLVNNAGTVSLTSPLPIVNGGTNNSIAYSSGSLIFSNGTKLTEDNANFFADDANNRLGIGTAAPFSTLHLSNATAPRLSISDPGLAHGVTSFAPTDVFLHVTQLANDNGGAQLLGLSSGASTNPFTLHGIFGNTNPTDAIPAVTFIAGKRSGTAAVDLGSLETAYQFQGSSGTSNYLTILGSGNVGVGTVTPAHLLDVAGMTRSSNYTMGDAGDFFMDATAATQTLFRLGTPTTTSYQVLSFHNTGMEFTSRLIGGTYQTQSKVAPASITFTSTYASFPGAVYAADYSANFTARSLIDKGYGDATYLTGGTGWSILGNSATVDGTNFIGTTDDIPFNLKVNNQKAGRISRASSDAGSTFFGYQSGNAISSGDFNTGYGYQSLLTNGIGTQNTGVGYQSLNLNANGTNNVGVGYLSMQNNASGSNNTGVGSQALRNCTGSDNTGIGQSAGLAITTGGTNTFLGSGADAGSNLSNSTAIGAGALVTTSNSMSLGDISPAVNVGIGTTAPTVRLHVVGSERIEGDLTMVRTASSSTIMQSLSSSSGTGFSASSWGILAQLLCEPSGNTRQFVGNEVQLTNFQAANVTTGHTMIGDRLNISHQQATSIALTTGLDIDFNNGFGGNVTDVKGIDLKFTSLSTGTNAYGLKIADIPAGTNRFPIYQEGANGSNILRANTRIGSTTAPTVALDVTGAVLVSSTINGATITSTSGGVLTLANSSTLATSGANSITLTSTGATNVTLPTTGTLATLAGTETLTNKRITLRTVSTVTVTSATINSDITDIYIITGLAAGVTFNAPSGTPTAGQKLIIRVFGASSQTLTFTTGALGFRASTDLAFPASSTAGKTDYFLFFWNAVDSRWDFMSKVAGF